MKSKEQRLAEVRESLDRYVNHGCHPGGFLMAVLTNNLFGALREADEASMAYLKDICGYVWNELPSGCWGDPETVQAHMKGRD